MWSNKVIVVEFPIAHNELLETWKLRVTDWFTGFLVDVACEVR